MGRAKISLAQPVLSCLLSGLTASGALAQVGLSAAQLGGLEDTIRREQVQLRTQPQNKPLRSALAHHLDSLANYHELRGDNMSAARYFEAAAAVMRDMGDASGRAQAEALAKRALKNRQLRLEHLRKIHRKGAVIVASDWSHSASLDGKAALAYTSLINEKLRDTWSDAHSQSAFAKAGLPHFMSAVFKIDAAGHINSAKIVASCGDKAIDDLALRAIKSLKDVPPLLTGMGSTALFRAEFSK